MPYVDPLVIQNPATGVVASALWGDTVRDNFEYLVSPPRCSINGTATVTSSGVLTGLNGQTEDYDTDGMHIVTHSYMDINTAGRWAVSATASFEASASGTHRYLEVYQLNTSTRYTMQMVPPVAAGYFTVLSGTRFLSLTTGDTIQIRGRQDTGGALSVTLDDFTAVWLGR